MEPTPTSTYQQLPNGRWIRVLLLEPAKYLDDPLIATLQLQDLGEHLPAWPLRDPADGRWKDNEHYERASYEYWQKIKAGRSSFTALSYSWATEDGDDCRTHHIEVDHSPHKITKSLADGLRRLRSATTTEVLWIDAICINKNDSCERNSQVSMMFDIYRLARRVIVWLGNGNADCDNHTCALTQCVGDILNYAHENGTGPGFP